MKPVKTIAAVGVAPELLEELREAIARTEERLDSEWRWASEQNPDLLVVDPGDFAARMARTRAQVTGVRYVVVGDAAKHATDRFVLLRPFRQDALAAVLNAAGSATVAASEFVQQDDSFYTTEYETGAGLPDLHVDTDARVPDRSPQAAPGLDELIRGDPVAGPLPNPAAAPPIPLDVAIAAGGTVTERSAARRDQTLDRMRRAGAGEAAMEAGAAIVAAQPATATAGDGGGYRLERYLEGDLLGGPSRIAYADAPALTLDPKARLFHAAGDLTLLVPYCENPLARRDWNTLGTADLVDVRNSAPGRPYDELLWLLALLRGGGRLGAHLDPGGSYRISRAVAVDPTFHCHGAIAAAMAQPVRLHEIAAASGASMDCVFDVVNAYDAIGLLQWTPRPPRHAPSSLPPTREGLLSRLARRLGKR